MGMNGGEFLVIAVLALLVIGPERLPQYAAQLGRLARELRRMAKGAREQVRSELGPDFDDVDWQKLDPRQYDPRRIVREALSDVWEDEPSAPKTVARMGSGATRASTDTGARTDLGGARLTRPAARAGGRHAGGASGRDTLAPAPFDVEAT